MSGGLTGRIVKATGGFYYVDLPVGDGFERVECRGKGVLRKRGETPLVGDMAVIERTPEGGGSVSQLLPRTNSLIRPPLANLDRMVLVLSVSDPAPNLLVADTYLTILAHREIDALIALTKTDLASSQWLEDIYTHAGFSVYPVGQDGSGLDRLTGALAAGISAFCGNSGVGKSTLLNRIHPQLGLATGQTSKKLGRGRHTTRHVELLPLPGGGLVADTPGFSSLEMLRMGHIPKEELAPCFIEFAPYLGKCRFNDCSHTLEAGCAILEALGQGKVGKTRHENYRNLYAQAKEVKDWEQR
ncbi:MAG: ribosome small subunit-dependent GTPase A [Oscillospiraceae bacterium]|nr:ribosome small subunit-dependent GTPase A [Oscillospiraceae bacterium]